MSSVLLWNIRKKFGKLRVGNKIKKGNKKSLMDKRAEWVIERNSDIKRKWEEYKHKFGWYLL